MSIFLCLLKNGLWIFFYRQDGSLLAAHTTPCYTNLIPPPSSPDTSLCYSKNKTKTKKPHDKHAFAFAPRFWFLSAINHRGRKICPRRHVNNHTRAYHHPQTASPFLPNKENTTTSTFTHGPIRKKRNRAKDDHQWPGKNYHAQILQLSSQRFSPLEVCSGHSFDAHHFASFYRIESKSGLRQTSQLKVDAFCCGSRV